MKCPASLNHIIYECLEERYAIYNKTECSILTIAKNGMPVIINKPAKVKKVKDKI
jgi:hypothetical protein